MLLARERAAQLREQRLRPADQRERLGRKPHAPPFALDQLGRERVLQHRDPLAHRRLGQAQPGRDSAHRAQLRE
jgi:hypothetical protein